MKERHIIDVNKGLTGLAVLAMIALFDRWQQRQPPGCILASTGPTA